MAGYIGAKSSGIISGIDASIAELNLTDKAAANGVTEANKVLTADANKDVTAVRNLAATGNVTAGGAITATGASVGALARGAIQTGNASGVAAPLSKGAAGTVLTAGANDLSWVAASAGGEQTFTASGNISAGNLVGINSSGTVQVLTAEQSGIVQVGTLNPYQVQYTAIGAATNGSDKIAIAVAVDNSTSKAVVGTLNGTSISYGSPVAITSNNTRHKPKVVYDANTGKYLYVYFNGATGQGLFAVVGTVSGTSISFGSEFTIDSSGNDFDIVYSPDDQKTLCFYRSNTERMYAKVLTISGTSVSAGSLLTVDSGANHKFPRLSYDTTANKYLGVFEDGTVGRGRGRVFTISGTSVTMGAEATFNNASVNYMESSYNPVANRHVASYYSSSGGAFAIAATISGTSVTFGTKIQFPVTFYGGCDYNPVLQQTQLSSYGYNYYYSVIFGSGNTISLSTTSSLWNSSGLAPATAAARFLNIDASRNFWIWETENLTYSQVKNENSPRFVGLAKENISNGATGKVTIMGGINTSVSNLTAGKNYGLLPTGTALSAILPSSGDASAIIGTALSSSSIYIDKGNLR